MNRYTAYFSTNSKHAFASFSADNPKDALRMALAYDQTKLDYRPVGKKPLAIIRILDEEDDVLASWYSRWERMAMWSHALLQTLKAAEIALSMQPNVFVPDVGIDTHLIAKTCRKVIADAEGREP